MMRMRLAVLLAALFFGTASAAVVENAQLRLTVDTRTGSIVGLFDKRLQREYIADPAQARLFELLIPDAANYSRRIVSWNQQAASVQAIGNSIEIRYELLRPDEEQYRFGSGLMHFAEPQLPIEARITLQLQVDHVAARMRIVNRSLVTVTGVVFPYLGGLPSTVGSDGARIIVPSVAQRMFTNTTGAFSGQRTHRYPGMLASSWVGFELGAAGLGIEAQSDLSAQDAYFALNAGPFRDGSAYRGRYSYPFIAWIHYPHIAGQGAWESPASLVHVHDSDWHTMAAEHRDWFDAMSPQGASATWRETLGFATYRLKRDDNTIDRSYRDIAALAATAKQAGMNRVVIEGWRQQEGPANPAPFGEKADPRLGDAAALKQVVNELKSQGVELIFAVHPTLINVTQEEQPAEIAFWAVKTRRGANQLPVSFIYSTADYPEAIAGPRYRVEIDPASAASEFLLQDALRLRRDYGFEHLLLKGVGQQAFLSYNRHHGVAPQSVYARGYGRLLGDLRKAYPGLLLTEGFNDLVNGFSDGAYTWNQSRDPAVLAYSVPRHAFSNDVEALDYAAANSSFAHRMLTNLIVDGGQGTVAEYPEFARHLRDLQQLKIDTRPYYADAEFRDQDGLKKIGNAPGVLTTVFVNRTGARRGVVLANLTDQPQTGRFELLPGIGVRRAAMFLSAQRAKEAVTLRGPRSVSLAPYQVALVAIDGR